SSAAIRLDRPPAVVGVGGRETWAAKRPKLRGRAEGIGGEAHRQKYRDSHPPEERYGNQREDDRPSPSEADAYRRAQCEKNFALARVRQPRGVQGWFEEAPPSGLSAFRAEREARHEAVDRAVDAVEYKVDLILMTARGLGSTELHHRAGLQTPNSRGSEHWSKIRQRLRQKRKVFERRGRRRAGINRCQNRTKSSFPESSP
ncbi:hypothetical protein THAOC_28589, partial [Thalassiosira oceanica]